VNEATPAGPSTFRTVFIASGAGLAALTALKFFYILFEEDFDLFVRRYPVAAFLGWFFTVGQANCLHPTACHPPTRRRRRRAVTP
jgi:hypothetical protein